jgi:hypothetical protein
VKESGGAGCKCTDKVKADLTEKSYRWYDDDDMEASEQKKVDDAKERQGIRFWKQDIVFPPP